MRVFNLTDTTKIYKGKPIPPNGGFVDFPGLDFIPTRDRALEEKRILSFGALPAWFIAEQEEKRALAEAAARGPKNALVTLTEDVAVSDSVAVELKKPEQPKPKGK
jgi:hypothetical protein